MPSAVVAGAMANKPGNGGEAWVRLSWALGLRRLGFDVTFLEQIDSARCVDREGDAAAFDSSVNREYFETVSRDFGLAGSACLICDDGARTAGLGLGEALERAQDSDVLVNLSGHLSIPELLEPPRLRLYVDLDPGFTQFWHAEGSGGFRLSGHDAYATVGANVGAPDCAVPDAGIDWIATLPPVLIDEWAPLEPPEPRAALTTVATWRSPLGVPSHHGRTYPLKHHEFRKLIALPRLCPGRTFEVALAIDPGDVADRRALEANGWTLLDPVAAAGDPRAFQRFVERSAAEVSTAQGVYVETRCGWFSDRTAAYLAAGRPAVVQDTALDPAYAAEGGLLTFAGLDGAVEAIAALDADYEGHSRAARELARRHLDSDLVLGLLLDRVGVSH